MEIWVIRHGQTLDNFTRILAGHQPGELSKLGVTQAQKTGKALQKEFFNAAYVSDLNRTRKTFENIFVSLKRCKNMKVFFESLLREKAGGDLEGESIDLPKKLAQEANIDIRFFTPKNGESWNDVFGRATNFLLILIERHVKQNMGLEPLGKGYVQKFYEQPKAIEEKLKNIEPKEQLIEEKPKFIEKKKVDLKEKKEYEEEKIPNQPEKNKKILQIFNGNNTEKNSEEVAKRKLSDHLNKKNPPLIIRKKGSLVIEDKEKEDDKNMKKILVVSHGGFIMELFNSINFILTKAAPVYANRSQNCSINVIYVYCKNTKGRCSEKCPENNDCVRIDILKRNEIKHLI